MTEEQMREVQLSRKEIYKGRVVHLLEDQVRLPDGQEARREVILHPGGVGILPLMEDGTVLVVRQFRYPQGKVLTEIPAGKLEFGEDPLSCGKRELQEEVGAAAEEWVDLGTIYPTPALRHRGHPHLPCQGAFLRGTASRPRRVSKRRAGTVPDPL